MILFGPQAGLRNRNRRKGSVPSGRISLPKPELEIADTAIDLKRLVETDHDR